MSNTALKEFQEKDLKLNGERLRKVTDSGASPSGKTTISTLEETFTKDKITTKDLPASKEERKRLIEQIEAHLRSLEGSELDDYLDRIDSLVEPGSDMKNQRWERTHLEILVCISRQAQESNRLPSITEIAQKTKYSRKTIHAHFADFETSPFFREERQKFKILNHTVLTQIFRSAIAGDVRASRLFLEFTGAVKSKGMIQNYIQINSLLVTEEMIKVLPEARLIEIESLIKMAISEEVNSKNKEPLQTQFST